MAASAARADEDWTDDGTASDGRIFRTARGGLIPAQQASPLARRSYDLRHVGVSLALKGRAE